MSAMTALVQFIFFEIVTLELLDFWYFFGGF
jgi:hypothetical protein